MRRLGGWQWCRHCKRNYGRCRRCRANGVNRFAKAAVCVLDLSFINDVGGDISNFRLPTKCASGVGVAIVKHAGYMIGMPTTVVLDNVGIQTIAFHANSANPV